jgi:hypothetical protein
LRNQRRAEAEVGGGVQKQLQLSLQGRDMAVLDRISREVMRRARRGC